MRRKRASTLILTWRKRTKHRVRVYQGWSRHEEYSWIFKLVSLSWLHEHYKHYEVKKTWFLRSLWNLSSWPHIDMRNIDWMNHFTNYIILLYGNRTLIFKAKLSWRILRFKGCWILAWKSCWVSNYIFTFWCSCCKAYCLKLPKASFTCISIDSRRLRN